MDINKMRNMVILKDLPSNLIEEAFVVLKENQKIPKLEYVDNKYDKFSEKEKQSVESEDEFVVKEAELLISNYISKMENQDLSGKNVADKLMKKYRYSKISSIILSCLLFTMCLYILFIN